MLLRNVIFIIYNICTHFNFLIYRIFIEIVIFCNYTHTNLENFSCNSIHIYYLYNVIQINRIHIIFFVIPSFIYIYLERNNYSEKTAFEYSYSYSYYKFIYI